MPQISDIAFSLCSRTLCFADKAFFDTGKPVLDSVNRFDFTQIEPENPPYTSHSPILGIKKNLELVFSSPKPFQSQVFENPQY